MRKLNLGLISRCYQWLIMRKWYAIFIVILMCIAQYVTSLKVDEMQVVIARYKEDLSWVEREFPNENVIIYNKGPDDLPNSITSKYKIVSLPNFGRETHTYLYHIVHNYDHLAERTLFLQGNPFDHQDFLLLPLMKYKKRYHIKSLIYQVFGIYPKIDLPGKWVACQNIISANCVKSNLFGEEKYLLSYKWANPEWIRLKDEMQLLTRFLLQINSHKKINEKTAIGWVPGAQFAVDGYVVRRHSKELYEMLMHQFEHVSDCIESHYMERLWSEVFAVY